MTAIAITGIGLRTAIGRNAVQTAAAVRAGIDRFVAWPQFPLVTEDGPALAVADALGRSAPDGLIARASALLQAPTCEAIWDAGLPHVLSPPAPLRLGAWLSLPSASRASSGRVDATCWADLAHARPAPVPHDQAGGLMALAAAQSALTSGSVDVAVVGGVDSRLDVSHLEALFAEGRLKTSLDSEGLMPGEAGVVVVLERVSDCTARGRPPLALLTASGVAREAGPSGPAHPVRGEALSSAIRHALEQTPPERVRRVLVDLNGERWRFLEWALVEARLGTLFPPGWRPSHPAEYLGDTGAAAGLVQVVLAARSFARRYHGGGDALVVAMSDAGERAACVVSPPPHL